jgi:hypothetical protein
MRASSRIGSPGKAAQILEEGNGSLKRERERERVGWGGGGRESKVSTGRIPNLSYGTKMLGEMPHVKKAQEKTLKSKIRV